MSDAPQQMFGGFFTAECGKCWWGAHKEKQFASLPCALHINHGGAAELHMHIVLAQWFVPAHTHARLLVHACVEVNISMCRRQGIRALFLAA